MEAEVSKNNVAYKIALTENRMLHKEILDILEQAATTEEFNVISETITNFRIDIQELKTSKNWREWIETRAHRTWLGEEKY